MEVYIFLSSSITAIIEASLLREVARSGGGFLCGRAVVHGDTLNSCRFSFLPTKKEMNI